MNEITVSDLNLVLQIVIFILFLVGISYIKRSRNVKKHRIFMAAAILLNLLSIILVMGRSFLMYIGLLVERFYDFGPFVTWIHASIGGVAEIMAIKALYKHPKKILVYMRTTAVLWTIALLLGITLYIYYYVIPH